MWFTVQIFSFARLVCGCLQLVLLTNGMSYYTALYSPITGDLFGNAKGHRAARSLRSRLSYIDRLSPVSGVPGGRNLSMQYWVFASYLITKLGRQLSPKICTCTSREKTKKTMTTRQSSCHFVIVFESPAKK